MEQALSDLQAAMPGVRTRAVQWTPSCTPSGGSFGPASGICAGILPGTGIPHLLRRGVEDIIYS